ncbi:non-ribosomal peptide synthase protein (TIGR01720 family)/amino acid adenylation domain-containing protein [Lentzea atacamensis]|uniref:Non-ribosomal peptide synthase protein (TIGR01720 family)/amino acid adenylation domain-containing protein n=1 Tax=Lentzea atacamensis TaxID=531938 RepID=A0A316HSD5_9PSEU|nr:non-ribosomal peptide synthetase [Lentzea atacamensis]PWK81234.1 non-ribosomal peptide synthase protein (TIGR01720 family)/amino acid adenylation domain-containing protein [Lentzea atacamensis]
MYPLAPVQQGMLFHVLEAQSDKGVYWAQGLYEFDGALDLGAMRRAWELVVARHAVLRTGFVWEGVPEPLQVVMADVQVPFEMHDWSAVTDRKGALDELLGRDRAQGFDLTRPPLMRVHVINDGTDHHRMVWSLYSGLCDGWSVPVVLEEVGATYDALCRGTTPDLEPVRPYRDFIAWLGKRDRAEAESFWRNYLAGFDAPTALPVDRSVRDHWAQGRRRVELPQDLTTGIMNLARRRRVTPSTVIQAAWALLLAAYSGDDEVVYGLTVSGRPADLPGVESMVGVFINTLPVRVRVAWERSFADWLGELQENQVAVQRYEFTALSDIKRWSDLPRGSGVFDSIVVFGNYPQALLSEEDEDNDDEDRFGALDSVEQVNYPIAFAIDLEDTLKIEAEFSTGAFDETTVDRLLDQLQAVLASAVARPEQLVREVTPAPVTGWGAGAAFDEPFVGLAERFRLAVDDVADQVAVRGGGQELTYAELGERVARVASGLRAAGVGVETRVGLWFERSVDLVVAILGVVQAGGTYVPLDPALPHGRLRDVQAAAGVELVVSRGDYALEGPRVVDLADLVAAPLDLAGVDAAPGDAAAAPAAWPESVATPQRLVYTMFTSGSTGVPKGVEVTEEGVVRVALDPAVAARPGDVVAHMAAVSFDASTWEIWTALLTGATLAVAPSNLAERLDVAKLYREHGVTLSFMTTGLFHQLADTDPAVFAGHRLVLAGGEAMSPVQARKVLDANPSVAIHNMYGPTETTVYASSHDMHTGRLGPSSVPIGTALRGLRFHVLDRWLQPTPVGVPGELYIGGTGLARGYADRPDLAAERFVPDPSVPGARMYRTGDLVRWGADGAVDFVGRTDDQVKIRGFRVEPGEVEHVLVDHPEVANAAVIVQDKRLIAYVVSTAEPAGLRRFLAERLPEFLVPSAIVPLPELPLNANGKLDKRALPDPGAPETTTAYEAPSTDAERTLAAVWSEVLGVERVGVHDNFFELGGDSIVSLQIVARARAAGLQLGIPELFTHQTVRELAARVTTAAPGEIDQGTVSGPVAFTPIQRWFLRENLPERDHFNWSGMFELAPGTDAATMRAALGTVVAHHDSLRLRLHGDTQENAPAETAELVTVLDAATLDGHALDEAVTAAMTTAQTSLSLVDGPLLRAVYVDRGDRPAWFGLTVHHYVVDAVSWNVLLEDLDTAYTAGALGQKTTSYQEWAAALEAFDPQDELPWWQEVVRTTTAVPTDLDGPNTEDSTESVRVALDAERTSALLTVAHRAYRTQGHELLLAALLQVLGRWTGTSAAAIDLESHGREPIADGIDLSRTVGWFTAIHPVGLHHADLGDIAGVVKAVKEQLRAVPRRGVGYTVLRERDEQLRSAPARPVVFNYLGGVDAAEDDAVGLFTRELSEELCGPAEGDGGLRSHVLGVEVAQAADGTLSVEWQYSTNLHRRETISRLAEAYVQALADLVDHCRSGAHGITPSDVPLASLDQSSLDALVARTPGLADVYPLSPLQQGMLFHAVESPDSGVYWTQDVRELTGELDVDAMRAAWQLVVDRHPALRTAFVWEGVREPFQVVVADVEVPFEVHDWSAVADPDAAVEELLAEDRARGCDLATAPLLRVHVARGRDRHWILLAFHHLYADGWSIPLLWDEVTAAYRGEPLPPVRPYRDFIAWLCQRDRAEAEAFWREYLAGFDSPTPLPVDRVVREHWAQDRRELGLPRDVTAALVSLARDQRVTLSTVVQAAWAVLLSAYSGEDDVVFGLTVSGRPAELPGVESIVGLFINTLPVRVRVAWERPFADWLGELQENQVAVQRHEHTPLADIQRVATGGLFDSMLVFGNYPQGAMPEEGEEDPEELFASIDSVEQMHYPMILAVDLEATLKVEANFSTGAFDPATVERLLGQLADVLTAAAHRPLAVVREVTPAPVTGWGVGPAFDEPFVGLAERFRSAVAEFADDVAVRGGEVELTYAELGERVARVASGLRAAGVRDETRVGLWFERSVDLVVAILGVVQAGGTYVPLDPALPHGRLRDVQAAAGVELVVSRGDYALEGPRVVDLGELSTASAEWPELVAVPERLVYTMFTSGSTGVPKGVEITEEGVLRVVLDPAVTARPGDVVAHMAAVSFDASTWEIWTALLSGATLAVASANLAERLDVAAFYASHGVTLSFMTTGLFHQLADTDPEVFSGHRKVLAGGEGMSPAQARKVLDANPAVAIYNMYGPTESTVYASFHDMHTGRLGPATVPIGGALRGLRFSVLDRWLRPTPVGVPGELYIGGAGLARGYAGRADLAAERFVPDPSVPGARMYRTGDLVRWGADGAVDFVGRTDDQVKIRGFRVEPGEVEHVLVGHPDVANAAVVVRELQQGKRLVAYVVGTAEPADLRGFLAERLPEFLVPSAIVPLDELPLNSNGKLDKRALPLPDAPDSTSHEPPSTDVERTLAAVWSEVLGVERVGVHDNYFELGGDSIVSLQIVARAREAGLELKIADLFTHQTIQQLAVHTGVASGSVVSAEPLADLEPLRARVPGLVDAYPLSPMQQGMLFHVLEAPADTAVYWAQDVRELRGPLDVAALREAWRVVVSRHPALRSAFVWEGVDSPVQVVLGEVDVPFEVLDWTSAADPDAALDELLDADQRRGFDVTTAPLLRVYVADRGDRQWVVFTFHHLYLDGWSIPLVWDEVIAAYRGQSLPAVRPYRDYIAWLQQQPAADDFWREYLDGFTSPTALPVDRTARLHWEQGRRHRELPENVALALEDLARRERVTISAVVQAAWALLLASHSGEDDVVFGLTVSGRPASLAGVESIVGLFINTLPVRIRVPGDLTPFDRWLRTVQDGQVAVQRFEHSPLVDIQRVAGVPRLFESIVAVQNLPGGFDDGDDADEFDSPALLEQGRYPLKLVVDVDGQLALLCEYSTGAFDDATVEALLDQLERILTTVAGTPGTPVREIALLDVDRRAEVLGWGSSTPRSLPATHLAALFGRQVVAHPDRVALRGGVELTYAQLDRRASGVARWLRDEGVGEGTRVGLYLDRSAELIIAMLGVIGAGGSYVPLDPAQGTARITQMIETADVGLVVTAGERTLDGLGARVLELPSTEAEGPLPVTGEPGSELYVLFTSGSTGEPKGVSLTHEGVARVCTDPAFSVEPGDVVSHLAGIGFDTGAFEIWLALLNGATLVVGPADVAERMDVGKFLRQNDITASLLTTGLFHQLVETSPDVLDGLRLLVVGGDALQAQHARTARERRPDLRIVNAYGPTETTMTCTVHTLEGTVDAQVPIGRPFAGMRAYVLDTWLQVLPPGVAGELFVGGPGVARGYVGRADLTAERFVPDRTRSGERLYRTGDRARWRADGTLEFLGRADDQVKIRGFRVEPGEVEALLTAHEDVRAAAVVATTAVTGKRLVAYVVTDRDTGELRAFLRERLPDYLVPSAFVVLDALPLTANGKLDRRALPEPAAPETDAYVAPRTDAERALAAIWATLLGAERVGVHDNFFDLGGDSIASLQVVARARAAGLGLAVADLFTHQTVAELAAVTTTPMLLEGGPVTGPVPLTPIQRWFTKASIDDRNHWNWSGLFELAPDVDAGKLAAALNTLVTHHDALRTRLHHGPDGWHQHVVDPGEAVAFTVVQGDVQQHMSALQRSLDLAGGPLVAAVLFDRGEEPAWLGLVVHHLVVDGVSWNILLEDLDAAYHGEPLPPKTTSFRQWAESVVAFAGSDEVRAELPYWTTRAETAFTLPVDATGANTEDSAAVVEVAVDAAGLPNTRVLDVILAALLQTLGEWAGTDTVVIDLEHHGREILAPGTDLSRTVGWFTSVYPVVLQHDDLADHAGVVEAVGESRQSVPRHGVGYGALRHLTADDPDVRRLRAAPDRQINVNFTGGLDSANDDEPGLIVDELPGDLCGASTSGGQRPYALHLEIERTGEGELLVEWHHSTNLHRTETVRRIATRFRQAAEGLIEHLNRN